MKKFSALHEKTSQALDALWIYDLDDPEITAWRHGPAVDCRVSNLIRHLLHHAGDDPFTKVCAAAGLCRDESFFQQVAHCFEHENKGHQPCRAITDLTVTRAYEAAQQVMREGWTQPPGKLILRQWIPTAAAVAKQIDLIMGTTGTPAAEVVDLCARKSLALELKKNGKVGRPRNK